MGSNQIDLFFISKNNIHISAIKFIIDSLENYNLQIFDSISTAQNSCCKPDIILINGDEKDQYCPNLMLIELFQLFRNSLIICYTDDGMIIRKVFKKYSSRLLFANGNNIESVIRSASMNLGKKICNTLFSSKIQDSHYHKGITINSLSPREIEVLCLIGKGHGIAQIAKIINLSDETVKTHLKGIRKKMNLYGIVDIRYLAAAYSRLKSCTVFSDQETHICTSRNMSVGSCPIFTL